MLITAFEDRRISPRGMGRAARALDVRTEDAITYLDVQLRGSQPGDAPRRKRLEHYAASLESSTC